MNPRDSSAIDAARLYYERGLSQADVAGALGVSRPTVSKLIQHAKDRGFVTVTINDPRDDDSALADALRRTFGLTQVRLSRSSSDAASTLSELGQAGAAAAESPAADAPAPTSAADYVAAAGAMPPSSDPQAR